MRLLGSWARLILVTLLFALAPPGAALAADEAPERDLGTTLDAVRQSSDWSTARETLRQEVERAASPNGDTENAIRTLEDLASRADEMGLPLEAAELYERALTLRDGALLGETPDAADVMERLAAILQPLGRFDRAEALLRRALEIRERTDGPGAAKVQSLLGRLSKLIQEARPADDEAEALLLRRLELADSYALRRQVAEFYSARGDSDRALEQFHESLAQAEKHPRNSLYWRAPALANLAREYDKSGNEDLAEAYLVQALEAAEAQYGSRHPYLAWAQRNLGEFYVERERYVEAEIHLDRALELKQLAYGPCGACSRDVTDLFREIHAALGVETDACFAEPAGDAASDPPEEGTVEAQLASLDGQTAEEIRRRELARARETAQRSLELRERTYGNAALETTQSLKLLARVAHELKRSDDEMRALERYLAVLELHLPPKAPAIAGARNSAGRLARREGDDALALEYYTRESYARESTGQNLALARTLKALGEISHDLGDDRGAGEFYSRAADLWELMAGRHAADYVQNRVALAGSYHALGLTAEAESALLELLPLEEGRDPARPDLLLKVLEPLSAVYSESDRNEEAEALRLRIASLRQALRRGR